jgi:carboxybiotin decarboxylase
MGLVLTDFGEVMKGIWENTGFYGFGATSFGWQNAVMILIALLLLYLAIFKEAEPYLLIPMGIGMLLSNLPFSGIMDVSTESGSGYSGLLGVLYYGVKYEIYPCLIFMGIGATTDFGPLISNPKTLLLGAAAQIGIFVTFLLAILVPFPSADGWTNFTAQQAASIGIIGGADGPTAILTTTKLAPELLANIAIAAYSYMALVPFIQPPIIRALTTKKERLIHMDDLKPVSKTKKILFPIGVTLITVLLVPSCAPLIGCFMFGNLVKESGVVKKLTETISNSLLYTITILLGLTVGATAKGSTFLTVQTLWIFMLGIIAFCSATAGGVLIGKLMCKLTHGKVNPMIGAAGVSAVPMAARVVQKEAQKEDPSNFLLMQAMGPNVAGVIGSAVAAGLLIQLLG